MGWLGGAALLVVTLGWGCASEGGDDLCEVPGRGTGICCEYAPGVQGACINNLCTPAGADAPRPDPVCGAAPRDRGVGTVDAAVDVVEDASVVDPGDSAAPTPDGAFTDAAIVDDVGVDPDAALVSCDEVVCAPDERCDPATSLCESQAPRGPGRACDDDETCPGGACLTEEATDGSIPGGFCRVICEVDAECGAEALCRMNGEEAICFEACGADDACRPGWVCIGGDVERGEYCLPDCRVVGCDNGGVCDAEGACGPTPETCAYACGVGERCERSRCVRADGSCLTDYHCPLETHQCHEGRCVLAEFTDCANDGECSPAQICVPTGEDVGLCLFSCVNHAQCPVDKACYDDLGACYFIFCGPGSNADGSANGAVYGGCAGADWQGTCLPLSMPDAGEPETGLCLEAGVVAPGGVCDDQADGRAAADRAVQCAPGALCFGDPDDPLDPAGPGPGRGECAPMCDPRVGACTAGTCVDFSTADDAATPTRDETRYVGLCLASDCDVLADDCGAGRHCRPYNFTGAAGLCGAAGEAGAQQPCETHADCAGHGFCANTGNGPVCLTICDTADGDAGCGPGQQCFSDAGWAMGVCL